jgi:glycosyltransferase involved in cell wall biosynthesis
MKNFHKIHYIAQYGENQLGRELAYSPAGLAKMKYIIKSLKTLGLPIIVYSTSSGGNISGKFYWTKTIEQGEKLLIRYCATFGSKYFIFRLIERALNKLQLLIYLLNDVNNRDLVVVYHELYYLPILWVAKKIRKFRLLYQVEELYTLASNMNEDKTEKEKQALMMADAYMFSNDIMAKKCGFDAKPFVVSYGSYTIEPKYVEQFHDGKIHVLYAGTFDENKGGAIASVRAAEYLDENYHLHIIGFGSDDEIRNLSNEIEHLLRKTEAIITYDGCLLGKEYVEFLQKCHIGLSTQKANGRFIYTSFPSKILSYFSNGLYVVSNHLEVLEKSKINSLLIYCDDNSPKAIAGAIIKVNRSIDYNSRAVVEDLDQCFVNDLKKLFNDI